jgi:hypothetical protein
MLPLHLASNRAPGAATPSAGGDGGWRMQLHNNGGCKRRAAGATVEPALPAHACDARFALPSITLRLAVTRHGDGGRARPLGRPGRRLQPGLAPAPGDSAKAESSESYAGPLPI